VDPLIRVRFPIAAHKNKETNAKAFVSLFLGRIWESNGGGLGSLHPRSGSGMAEPRPTVLNEQGACDDVSLETVGRFPIAAHKTKSSNTFVFGDFVLLICE
jgi:hypothetical protein